MFIAMFIAKFLDPVSIIASIAASFLIKKTYHIFIAGIVIAMIVEAILTSTQDMRDFGEGLILGIVVSTIHVVIFYWIKKALSSRDTTE